MPTDKLNYLFRSFVPLKKEEIIDLLSYLESKQLNPIKFGLSATRPKFEHSSYSKLEVADYCYKEGRIDIKGDNFTIELEVSDRYARPLLQSLTIKISKKTDLTNLAILARDLFVLFKACYAYVDLNYTGDTDSTGRNIEECLAGFSWLNLFGKPYIDLWGKVKMLNAPAYKVEDHDELITIMISETPFHDSNQTKSLSIKLKNYFGLDYFYKYALEHRKTTFKSISEIVKYDLENKKRIHYLAPDFHKYYQYDSNSTYMFLVQKEVFEELEK